MRRGYCKATAATAHKTIRVFDCVLKHGVFYVDPETDCEAVMVQRNTSRRIRMLKNTEQIQRRCPPQPDGRNGRDSTHHINARHRAALRGARTARPRQPHGASRPPIGETVRLFGSRMCYTAKSTPALLKTMTTPDRASLSEEIASWDGKSAAALQSTYERHCAEECFVATILAHIADVELQRAATWLLKKHLETGNSLNAADCRAIFGALPFQEHWESKLHILQCVSYLDVPEDESAGLEKFLQACLESDNKFVRAWTYNGFNELSLRFPRYRERVDGMLAWASVSEAASVRARIRNMTRRR